MIKQHWTWMNFSAPSIKMVESQEYNDQEKKDVKEYIIFFIYMKFYKSKLTDYTGNWAWWNSKGKVKKKKKTQVVFFFSKGGKGNMGAPRRLQRITKALFLKLGGKSIVICFTVILSPSAWLITVSIYYLIKLACVLWSANSISEILVYRNKSTSTKNKCTDILIVSLLWYFGGNKENAHK